MKLKFTMLSLMGALALNASAQDQSSAACKTSYEKSTSHNWFLTFQGGAAMMFNGDNDNADFGDRLRFLPSVSVGKWHTPYIATRFKVLGGQAVSYYGIPKALDKSTNYFVGGHLDLMFDLMALGRDAQKPNAFRLIPYLGLGYEYKFDHTHTSYTARGGAAHVGLQLAYRVSPKIDIVCEGEGSWNNLSLSRTFPIQFENSLRFALSAGLNFRLGKSGFTPVRPANEAAIKMLQSDINRLRAENAELAKRPVKCPDLEPQMPLASGTDRFLADKSILFTHGNSRVSQDQLITIFDAAQFVKEHDGELLVIGYVQKSESRFKDLAQKRAQAVANELTEKYGVPTHKITVEWKEAGDAPFDAKNAWNRMVVIRSK